MNAPRSRSHWVKIHVIRNNFVIIFSLQAMVLKYWPESLPCKIPCHNLNRNHTNWNLQFWVVSQRHTSVDHQDEATNCLSSYLLHVRSRTIRLLSNHRRDKHFITFAKLHQHHSPHYSLPWDCHLIAYATTPTSSSTLSTSIRALPNIPLTLAVAARNTARAEHKIKEIRRRGENSGTGAVVGVTAASILFVVAAMGFIWCWTKDTIRLGDFVWHKNVDGEDWEICWRIYGDSVQVEVRVWKKYRLW